MSTRVFLIVIGVNLHIQTVIKLFDPSMKRLVEAILDLAAGSGREEEADPLRLKPTFWTGV